MVSASFLCGLATAPWPILKTVLQFYTTGTTYTRADPEFKNSLRCNIVFALMSHMGDYVTQHDFQAFAKPVDFKQLEPPLNQEPSLGELVADKDNLTWVLRPENAKKAILFFHGGGYAMPLLIGMVQGILALRYALASRDKYAIALLDYLVTACDKTYPTQIHEATDAYKKLSDLGYDVVMHGDSAGGNLALAVARFFSYPDEARAHFSQYRQFSWSFDAPAPQHMVLISPWVQPSKAPQRTPGVDHSGDSSPRKADMGNWYLGSEKYSEVWPFVDFEQTNYEEHWAQVPAFNGLGSALLTYGERELLRQGQESFIKKNCRNVTVKMQKGGFHDVMLSVETRNLGSPEDIVAGRHKKKWGYSQLALFLDAIAT
ncbi:hypothetical protein C7M61_003843 [Candidozyma pseudohaemuli]|uniref:Alpha/beta hydrolase fold-3 domain-containing protein n=1 Tax=Candidozyma pseudohaemuli TaxID=418784 RepID=A0A2P7YLX8_9ASCO|nr:hypothetical protein C7M61_003843 [[Candida] pseudohaemulonii]PSK36978.1 hypothetical protein C7M61_003843 [[Candida] pseudohaemulonii]